MVKPSLEGGLEDVLQGLNEEAIQFLTLINGRGGNTNARTLVLYCTTTLRWSHALITSAVSQLSAKGMIEPVENPLSVSWLNNGRFKVTPKGARF